METFRRRNGKRGRMKFQVGSLVVMKKTLQAKTSYVVHKVVGHLDGALLLEVIGSGFGSEILCDVLHSDTKIGSFNWRQGISRALESDVLSVEDTLVELRKLEEAKSKLEEEFSLVESEIIQKLDQAAVLTEDAASLIKKHNKKFNDVLKGCKPLYEALKAGGWSHSTMQCKFG